MQGIRRLGAIVAMLVLVVACSSAPTATQAPAGGGGGTGGLSGKGGTQGGQGIGGAQPGAGTQPGVGGAGQPAGLPAWLRVGQRLSWYASAASVAQSRFSWVEDPNGDWEDPRTGKRYRRSTDGPGGQGQATASGDGVSQVDVLAIEGTDVVLLSNRYTINRTGAQPTFDWTIGPGARVPGSVVDGAWIHPSILARYDDQRLANLLILRGPYAVGGRQYNATAFAQPAPGASLSYVYDSETGILLAATSATAGATSPFSAPGENAPTGNTQLTYTEFIGLRDRTLPGIGRPSPNWVAGTRTLRYGGVYNITNPINPSTGSIDYAVQYQVQFGPHNRTWSPYQASSFVQTLGEQTPVTSVTASTGLYWWDPAALAAMRGGAVLDQDPVTGQQIAVAATGGGQGGNVVSIDTVLPGTVTRASYDLGSGTLIAYETQAASSGTTIRLQLQGN